MIRELGKHVASATVRIDNGNTLDTLVDHVAVGYAGDVLPEQAYHYLSGHPDAYIIDVRTQAEWQFVGVPDLSQAGHELHLISWKHYSTLGPAFSANEQFAEQLSQAAPNKDAPLFFICRSGGRSTDAAILATTLGYRYSFNIAGGFEGEPDPEGKRGIKEGWKAAKLPWQQT